METAASVLAFWFSEHGPKDWFAKNDAFDAAIRARFSDTLEAAAQGALDDWATEPYGSLALIIVLDQFSRNLFRDDARAFAQDAKALALAKSAVERGFDAVLTTTERPFVYLPFEHSEVLADQERCVDLFTAMENADLLDWAIKHKVIIERFGRFPHRNAVLGRESTAAEQEFLEQPGSSF